MESGPDFRTISDFRNPGAPGHLRAFKSLFLEVLRLAGEMGLVKLGPGAPGSTDGTKMKANASRHKAMSYGHMQKCIARLQAEIEQLLKEAEQVDAESRRAGTCGTEAARRPHGKDSGSESAIGSGGARRRTKNPGVPGPSRRRTIAA